MNLVMGVEQDFHRPQKNPGAYEWWHFDGTDERSGYSFSIQFHAGNLFSAYYQDSLKTYWQRSKSPLISADPEGPNPSTPSGRSGQAGPNPLDYCGVTVRLFHKGSLVVESLQEFPARSLKASDKHGAVLLGPHRFNWDAAGDPPSYVLTTQAPTSKGTFRARLFFTPLVKDFPTLPAPEMPSTHTWVLAAPLCHVEGTFEWVDKEGEPLKESAFVGTGSHDHHFGTVPLDRFLTAWHWGRAFLDGEALIYSLRLPVEGPPEGFLMSAGPKGVRGWSVLFETSRKRFNVFGLPFHRTLDFTADKTLTIDHTRTLADGPVQTIFEDRLKGSFNGVGVSAPGLSHYLYLPRLSSRLFFPLLKGKSLIVHPAETNVPPPSGDVTTTRPDI